MKKSLAYAVLILGLLSVFAGNTLISMGKVEAIRTADITPFPPH